MEWIGSGDHHRGWGDRGGGTWEGVGGVQEGAKDGVVVAAFSGIKCIFLRVEIDICAAFYRGGGVEDNGRGGGGARVE